MEQLPKSPKPSDPRPVREPEEGMMKLTFGDWQLYLFLVGAGHPSVGWWESSGGQVWEAHVGEA